MDKIKYFYIKTFLNIKVISKSELYIKKLKYQLKILKKWLINIVISLKQKNIY